MSLSVCVRACVRACVRVCVWACVRACVRALRIVSRDKPLRFKNTFIIIINTCQSKQHAEDTDVHIIARVKR